MPPSAWNAIVLLAVGGHLQLFDGVPGHSGEPQLTRHTGTRAPRRDGPVFDLLDDMQTGRSRAIAIVLTSGRKHRRCLHSISLHGEGPSLPDTVLGVGEFPGEGPDTVSGAGEFPGANKWYQSKTAHDSDSDAARQLGAAADHGANWGRRRGHCGGMAVSAASPSLCPLVAGGAPVLAESPVSGGGVDDDSGPRGRGEELRRWRNRRVSGDCPDLETGTRESLLPEWREWPRASN
ncbi:hypothetical protein E2562_014963 [Oryza meyeriana var. granulata]|uniref:Uncharacterized protein n=1 Tax=Oryza meyeriana var. granulata TaxID=110450 RepID=A0A6G1EJE7_9ORYZ|nr:hypothetical protein E2562_014963 [Oryza meyeriana var. granulata]